VDGWPLAFTFLGFSHYCGKRLKDGAFIVWRETAKKRLVAKLQAIKLELTRCRHEPVASVGAWLRKVGSVYVQRNGLADFERRGCTHEVYCQDRRPR
jgi:hypothetical protein